MEGSGFSMLIFLGVIVFIWLLPLLIIISSSKTTGREKLAWVLAVIFISWLHGYFIFYSLRLKRRTEILINEICTS